MGRKRQLRDESDLGTWSGVPKESIKIFKKIMDKRKLGLSPYKNQMLKLS